MNKPLVAVPAIYVQGVVGRLEVVQFAGCPYNFFNPGIAKLDNFSGVEVDEVVMLHATVCFFKLGDIFSKLVLDYQVTIQ